MLKFLFTVVTVSPTAAIETETIITIISTRPAATSATVTSLLPTVTSYAGTLVIHVYIANTLNLKMEVGIDKK